MTYLLYDYEFMAVGSQSFRWHTGNLSTKREIVEYINYYLRVYIIYSFFDYFIQN